MKGRFNQFNFFTINKVLIADSGFEDKSKQTRAQRNTPQVLSGHFSLLLVSSPCHSLFSGPLMRCGWCRRLVPVHCCSFHCAAPFSSLSYFHVSSSAGCSPFGVVPPPKSLCLCMEQLLCLSIFPALA